MTERIAIYRNDNNHHSFTATAELQPGELVVELTKVGIVKGEAIIAIGDEVAVDFNARVDILKTNSATVYAKGATVKYDTATQRELAAGDVTAGLCSKPSAAGDKYVSVMLNFA